MDDFTGVGAVVTGGASGIGLGLATALLEDGARGVAVLDVEAAALDAAVAQLRSGFPDATVVGLTCDVADATAVSAPYTRSTPMASTGVRASAGSPAPRSPK